MCPTYLSWPLFGSNVVSWLDNWNSRLPLLRMEPHSIKTSHSNNTLLQSNNHVTKQEKMAIGWLSALGFCFDPLTCIIEQQNVVLFLYTNILVSFSSWSDFTRNMRKKLMYSVQIRKVNNISVEQYITF